MPITERPGPLSLVPAVAYVVTVVLAGAFLDDSPTSFAGLTVVVPFLLLIVALPCWLPLAAAPDRRSRTAVLAVLTAVATAAGYVVATSDDAQAGLAVLWILYVALPLALVINLLTWVSRRTRRGASR